jgi:hypothetical protein
MAERVTLTPEQAEALQKLRARHSNEHPSIHETEWVPVDEDTRPYKVLVSSDITSGTM